MAVRVGPLLVVVVMLAAILVAGSTVASIACDFITASDDANYLLGVALLLSAFAGSVYGIYKLPYSWAVQLTKEEQDA